MVQSLQMLLQKLRQGLDFFLAWQENQNVAGLLFCARVLHVNKSRFSRVTRCSNTP